MIEGFDLSVVLLIGTGANDGFRFTFPLATREDIGTANRELPSGEVTKAM